MKWVSAVSEHRFLKYAVAECAEKIRAEMGGRGSGFGGGVRVAASRRALR